MTSTDAMAGEQPVGPQPAHLAVCDYLNAVTADLPRRLSCACPEPHTRNAETMRPRLPLLYEHGVIDLPETPPEVAAGIPIV